MWRHLSRARKQWLICRTLSPVVYWPILSYFITPRLKRMLQSSLTRFKCQSCLRFFLEFEQSLKAKFEMVLLSWTRLVKHFWLWTKELFIVSHFCIRPINCLNYHDSILVINYLQFTNLRQVNSPSSQVSDIEDKGRFCLRWANAQSTLKQFLYWNLLTVLALFC